MTSYAAATGMAVMFSISALTGAAIASTMGVAPSYGLPMGASAHRLGEPNMGRAMRIATRPGRRPGYNDGCGVPPACISGEDPGTVFSQYDASEQPALLSTDATARLGSLEQGLNALLGA
jgi:hypothetical protein